jgi:photosystem II stability/assembly factor-like uncharacterized protein
MIITGTTYRSIASQNNLSYILNGSINNTSGVSSIWLSGERLLGGNGVGGYGYPLFTFRTGKIYDEENRHVWSYNPNQTFTISGNIIRRGHSYFINDELISTSSGSLLDFQDLYFKQIYFQTSNNCTLNLDFRIFGNEIPDYTIVFPYENTVGENVTGLIYNNKTIRPFSFEIFSGSLVGSPYYSILALPSGFISGQRSGQLIFNYTSNINPNIFSTGLANYDIFSSFLTLNTNFGDISYNIESPLNKRSYYYIELLQLFTGQFENINPNYPYYNYNYDLRTKSSENQNVSITLNNVNGHNNQLYSGNFLLTGIVSGQSIPTFIYGSEYITGLSTGLGTSTEIDYYGNFLNGVMRNPQASVQYATGDVRYFYNIPILGGSGLAFAMPGISVEGTGIFTQNINTNNFIYGSRQITGSASGLMTGFWFAIIQTGSGLMTSINENIGYFTGNNNINYSNFSWESVPYIGYDIENFDNRYKIYGITGFQQISFSNLNNGKISGSQIIYNRNQFTGILVEKSFLLSSSDILNEISGTVFGSENISSIAYVFGNDNLSNWNTSYNSSTGFLGFQFKNFSSGNSGIVTYYEIETDKSFSDYKFIPLNFKLQGSTDFTNWTDMDFRSNVDFYQAYTNVFPVSGTGNYHFIRMLITSGKKLEHINDNVLNTNPYYGLSISKINLYKTSRPVISGLYKNLIKNNVTNYEFISNFNTGEMLYSSRHTGFNSIAHQMFSGHFIYDDWSSINTSLDGRVQVATTKNSYIYISRNSGILWETGLSLQKDWTDSAISFNGAVITAVGVNSNIYISYDSGYNWLEREQERIWQSVDISYDGRNQIAIIRDQNPNPVYISYNSGQTWSGITNASFDGYTWRDVAISKTGRHILLGGFGEILSSSNTGVSWSIIPTLNDGIDNLFFPICESVDLSADGRIMSAIVSSNNLNKVFGSSDFGANWNTGETILIGSENPIRKISLSFNGNVQAIATDLTCQLPPCNDNNFTVEGGIYVNRNTGVLNTPWIRSLRTGIPTGIAPARVANTRLLENFSYVSVSSGGNMFYACPSKANDYYFVAPSEENALVNIWQISQLNKNIYPSIDITGGILGYKTYKTYANNILTGFYISFESGFQPLGGLSVQISNSGSNNYRTLYSSNTNNLIESGFLTGLRLEDFSYVSGTSTGYMFFRFLLTGVSGGLDSVTPTLCYTGWTNIQNGNLPFNQWRSIDTNSFGNLRVAVGNTFSGNGNPRYTGFVWLSNNFGNTWTTQTLVANRITGNSDAEVKFNSVAFDHNTGRFILVSRNGQNFNNSIYGGGAYNYKIYMSRNSGVNWIPTGNNGSWMDVAVSDHSRVMVAVGRYDGDYNISAQYSLNTGVTWTAINDLNGYNFHSVTMSSGGNIMYTAEYGGFIWKSTNSGANWSILSAPNFTSNWVDIATSNNGNYVAAVTDDGNDIWLSSDAGVSWNNVIDNDYTYRNIAMSTGGQYQLASYSQGVLRSTDFGNTWAQITGLGTFDYYGCSMSANGKYQSIGRNQESIYNNCTFGQDRKSLVKVKNANFYFASGNSFFETSLGDITGYGPNIISSISGSGIGSIFSITGSTFQPAVFYQTGLLTGFINGNFGSITFNPFSIGGTGSTNRVFIEQITGTRQATGTIFLNTGLLQNGDGILINDNYLFSYVTGTPSNDYQFNSLTGLIRVLNSGATGALDFDLQYSIGLTGFVHANNSGITLFSYYLSGEDGNNVKLQRYFENTSSSNFNSIRIPSRYLQSGQFLRFRVDNWQGLFTGDIFGLTIENTGIYNLFYDTASFESSISGVVFENNFDRNWVVGITPITEGTSLDTTLTTNLQYYPSLNIFSGNFTILSGLGYLGYSGLNIDFKKRTYISPLNTGNRVRYLITGSKFSFTGILEG